MAFDWIPRDTRRRAHVLALALAPWLLAACGDDSSITSQSATATTSTTSATSATSATSTTSAETGSTAGTTTQTTGEEDAGFEFAIILERAPYLTTPHASESPLGDGAALDPGTLHLFLSELELTCAEPEPQWSCAANNFRLHLAIPPDAQAVGVHAIPTEVRGARYFTCEADDCGCTQDESLLGAAATLEFTTFDASGIAGEYCRGSDCTAFSATRC
jgi:hypothetical protein